jgi:methionyl-tRNA formyltransferase
VTEPPWRIVILATPLPAVVGIDAIVRAAGHETVAVITPRRGEDPGDDALRLECGDGTLWVLEHVPA